MATTHPSGAPITWRLGVWLAALVLARVAAAEDGAASGPLPGQPVVQSFTTAEHGVPVRQVWASVERNGGQLYFALGWGGVLEFDGAAWRAIKLPFAVRALGIDAAQRIYVAGLRRLGYLDDGAGGFRYISLLELLPEEERDIDEVRSIVIRQHEVRGEEVLFASPNEVLLLSGGRLELLASSSKSLYRRAFLWRGEFYVPHGERGLLRLGEERLVQVPGSESLIGEEPRVLLPVDDASALILTAGGATFRFADPGVAAVELPVTDLLRRYEVTGAASLRDGRHVVGTARGGAVVLDGEGRVLQVLDEASGLPSSSVYNAMEDRQGNLWLSTDGGIGKVPRLPLVRVIDPETVEGAPYRSYYFQDRLWTGTRTSLYHLDSAHSPTAVEGLGGVWDFMADGDDLVVATRGGVFAVRRRGPGPRFVAEALCERGGIHLMRFPSYPGVVFVAGLDGLYVLRREGGEWACGRRFEALPHLVRQGFEAPDGRLVFPAYASQLYFVVTLPAGLDGEAEVASHELPRGTNRLLAVGDGAQRRLLLYSGELGWWRYGGMDAPGDAGEAANAPLFTPTEDFAGLGADGSELLPSSEERLFLADPEDDALETVDPRTGEHRRVAADLLTGWTDAYPHPGGGYWLSNEKGVFFWQPGFERRGLEDHGTPIQIRRAESLGDRQSLYSESASDLARPRLDLPWEKHSLRFEFAAQIYDQLGKSEYQVRLEGYDDWSPWGVETFKEYTNLPEGEYRFRARARDGWDEIHESAPLALVIRPPWFRSWWAWTLYALAGLTVLTGAVRLHRRRVERVEAINRRLREVDRLKDEFLAKTSHELRTPLYGIVGLADTVLEEPRDDLPPSLRKALEAIVTSGVRLSSLVDDILDFSKMRRGGLELVRRPIDVRAAVDVVLVLTQPLVGGRDLELSNAVPADLPPVHADENRLLQILHNLVHNAVKFTGEGLVEVSGEEHGSEMWIHVRDTGTGIPEVDLERVFEPFEQVRPPAGGNGNGSSPTGAAGGTGLGLALARQLAELHGGKLWVESRLGEGSTFSFSLPRATAARGDVPRTSRTVARLRGTATTNPLPAASGAGHDDGRARLLVVDDEPVNRMVLERQLETAGFSPVVVADGPEALARLEEESFDLVLLDIMMPRMSGYEVCRALRQRHSVEDLPVIFLTAKDQITDLVDGFAAGGNDYLVKPVGKEELRARVRLHLQLLAAHRRRGREVEEKAEQLRVLQGLLSICSRCKRIHDEDDHRWVQLESYIDHHSEATFSHGLCPECAKTYYDEIQSGQGERVS